MAKASTKGGDDQESPATPDRPALPSLTPDEVNEAVRSGGLDGLVSASRGKAGTGTEQASDGHYAVRCLLEQYMGGLGGPDHSDVLARMDRYIRVAEIQAEAMRLARMWVSDNPGTVVVDGSHGSGRRRVFPWTRVIERPTGRRVSEAEPPTRFGEPIETRTPGSVGGMPVQVQPNPPAAPAT